MRYVIVGLMLMLMVGCTTSQESGVTDEGVNHITVRSGGFDMYVQEVELSDGTRCAVAQGYYKGGITCNWRD